MSKKKPTTTSESCSKPTFEENSCSSENSFLKEMSFNSIIDDAVRKEIEKKYKKSKVNSSYVFPRKVDKKQVDKTLEKEKKRTPVKPKHRYCASNLPLGKSLPVLHRSSKSACASALYASHLKTMKKKVMRSTSCKKSSKEVKEVKDSKVLISGRQTPAVPHKRSASQNSKRPKTPACKETRLDGTCKRTKFRNKERIAEGKGDGRGDGRGEGKGFRDSKGFKDLKDLKPVGEMVQVKDFNGVVKGTERKKPRQLFNSMDQGFPNYIMKSLVEY